ncbi:hypothetical protein [Nocardia sp. CS682]|uniref:hypothetical protein n=1 Tax=Nocardia sp. CS682 TaxID=1047172 RepID=UPI001074F46B|nr:hypothetical protein [Nocardia sp. CS682]
MFSTRWYTGRRIERGIRELLRTAVRALLTSIGRSRPAAVPAHTEHGPLGRTVPRAGYSTIRQCVPARSSMVRRRQRGTGTA